MVKMKVLPRIREEKTIIADLLLIAIIALFSIGWFRGNNLIKTGDDIFPINPQSTLQSVLYIWVHSESTGSVWNTFRLSFLPFVLFLTALQKIGIDVITSEKIFYYISFTLSGIFTYLLVRSMIHVKNKRIAALASAFFYMMNPFSLSIVWWGHYTAWFFAYPFLPLALLLYSKGIETCDKKYAFLIALSQFFLMPVYASIPVFFIISLIILSYLVFYSITNFDIKQKIIPAIGFSIFTVVISFLLNAWFFVPNLFYFMDYYSTATNAYNSIGGSAAVFISGSMQSTMVNTIRLLGFYFIYADWYAVSVYYWAQTYSSGVFRLLSFVIPILAFCAVLLKPKDKFVLYFACLSIIGLFMAKGAAEPLGNVNVWVFENFPLGMAFRGNFEKIGIMVNFAYAILIGVFFAEFYSRIKNSRYSEHFLRKYGFGLLLITIAAIGILNYPFFTGEVIYPGSQYLPAATVQVPSYYGNASEFISEHPEEFRILDIPPRVGGTSAYNWTSGYIASDPIDQYYYPDKGLLISPMSDYEKKLSSIFVEGYQSISIEKSLSLLNVRYILVHRDWNSELIGWYSPSPELTTKVLSEKLSPLSFGKLDFYKVDDEYFLPHIYPATTAIHMNGSIREMFRFITSDDYVVGNNVIFLSNQTSAEQWQFIKSYNNTVEVGKYTVLTVQVYNGSGKSFDWKAMPANHTAARYYDGWKAVVETDGMESQDTITFNSSGDCPYKFPSFSSGIWNSFGSTLVYIKTDSNPLVIDGVYEGGELVKDIGGVWWESDWRGMMTKPVRFPVTIPENQKAIIQVNHIVRDKIFLHSLDTSEIKKINRNISTIPEITFKRVNPTKYQVRVNASQPFFLVFGESYDPQWKIYSEDGGAELKEIVAKYENIKVMEAKHEMSLDPSDIHYLFAPSLDEKYHFTANGYANAWYINPKEFDKNAKGDFTVTIYFQSQNLFYLGMFISVVTFMILLVYSFVELTKHYRLNKWK